jgi:glycosyltransferase involved in cell wall biosynthesis
MLEKIKKNYKVLHKVLSNTLLYFRKTSKTNQFPNEHKVALINLDKRIMNQAYGRFSYILCKYFENAGFRIVVRTNLYYYLNLRGYKPFLLEQNYGFVKKMPSPLNSIALEHSGKKQLIRIHYDVQDKVKVDYTAPFPMHPVQVIDYNDNVLIDLRKTRRTFNIFFAGNNEKNDYSAQQLNQKFNVISRFDVISFLKNKLDKSVPLKAISERQELYKLLHTDANNKGVIISEVKTDDADWLTFLSKANFFIAPPGVSYPWCHNSVEAMGVGTIPILQYSNLFYPQLEHKKNCLTYNNYDELEEAIKLAFTMKEEEIALMRQHAIAYFEAYLSPDAIAKKIITFSESNKAEIDIVIPFIM